MFCLKPSTPSAFQCTCSKIPSQIITSSESPPYGKMNEYCGNLEEGAVDSDFEGSRKT